MHLKENLGHFEIFRTCLRASKGNSRGNRKALTKYLGVFVRMYWVVTKDLGQLTYVQGHLGYLERIT